MGPDRPAVGLDEVTGDGQAQAASAGLPAPGGVRPVEARSIGATRRHVAAQFLTESVTIGFLGGMVGAAAGVLLPVAVSVARDWTPVLDLRLAGCAPLLGALIGLVAGTYPAWKASAVQPIAALRGGT